MSSPNSLQAALRRTRPFRSPAQEAGISLLRAADAFRRTLAEVVVPHGVTMQQYNVLRILRGAGSDGLPTLAVGERMIERTPGVTRLLDRLESDGLVIRARCAEDRRRVFARITDEGLELLARIDEPLASAEDGVFVDFEADEVRALARQLERLRVRLEAVEEEAEPASGAPEGTRHPADHEDGVAP
jgi:MarR family transcriptional regulator, organic hydroperoxide resistance regulator